MSVSPYALNQTMYPRSAGAVIPIERPTEGVQYVVVNQPTQDTLTEGHQKKKPNAYQNAMINRSQAPLYKRIGMDAVIFVPTMIGASLLMAGTIGRIPAVKNALNHHNPWVSIPANIVHGVTEWGVWEAMSELLLTWFWNR
jgi:hypothetical protein